MELTTCLESVIIRDKGIVQTKLASKDLAHVEKDRLYIVWIKGDLRTRELPDLLKALMHAIFGIAKTGDSAKYDTPNCDNRIIDIWVAFHTLRLKNLIHC